MPLKLGAGAALVLLAVLATVVADAHELLSRGGPGATAALKRGPEGFKIRGDLRRPLAPGDSQALNLRLTNPYRFSLKVKRLTVAVSVDPQHAAAGCRASPNFKATQLRRRSYPIRLWPRRTRTLKGLGVKRLPRVAMRNLPINQDACKGAQLNLRYAGRARRWRRGHMR